MEEKLELGYACHWYGKDRTYTWSHTPYHLMKALEKRSDVQIHDLPIKVPFLRKLVSSLLHIRFDRRGVYSVWDSTVSFARQEHEQLLKVLQDNRRAQAVLDIGEHGSIDRPHFIYQDFCYAHALHVLQSSKFWSGRKSIRISEIRKRADFQARTYERATGVFTMSRYNGQFMVENGLLPAEKVHVVAAGTNVPIRRRTKEELEVRRQSTLKRILFVGRDDFKRKGGDQLVAAFAPLYKALNGNVELVIAGPISWPLQGSPPPGVRFVGDVPRDVVRDLLHESDLLAVPSRFEAFGIIFVEALASGIPVIGRNICAMPEAIRHGVNGYLVDDDRPESLTTLLQSALENEDIANFCLEDADRVSAYYNWDRVADDMIKVIRGHVDSH